MALVFDTTYYLQQNPDVLQAILAGTIKSAEEHFNRFGTFEGRNPNAIFNTNEYLAANPDVLAAGVNGFQHYLSNGAYEGRAPNATFITFADFDADTYLAANPDLAEAGIDTALEAYGHFVVFGQFEDRPGAPDVGGNVGEIFTLTPNVDGPGATSPAVNTDGTAGNDTYLASEGTIGSADIINARAGTDTLSIRATAAGSAAPLATSLERVDVSNINNTVYTFNAASVGGLERVASLNSIDTSTTRFTNLAASVVARLDNADGQTDFNFTGAAGRTGTADAVTVEIANGSGTSATPAVLNITDAAALPDNTFENFNIKTEGAASVVTSNFGLANARVINVSGDAGLTLREAGGFAQVRTVDASGLTSGGLDIGITGGAQNVTFKGSAGNDAARMGGTLTTADVLDGGEGTDTIGVTAGGTLVTGLQVTGFETLDIGGADINANTFDVSKLSGITTLKVGSAINATVGSDVIVNNLAKGAAVEIGASLGAVPADSLTINVKDAGAGSPNDSINVALNARTAITTGGDLVIADIETVNLSATSVGTGVTHALSNLTTAQATSVNVNASTAGATISDLDALALVRFDASASVKSVSVTTGADAFSATGGTAFILGQGNDTLVLTGATSASAGTDFLITGGKGGDAITLSAAGQVEVLKYVADDSKAGVTSGSNNFDSVATFVTGEDKIDLSAFGFTGTSVASVRTGAAATINVTTGEVNAANTANFFGAGADQRAVTIVDVGVGPSDVWVYVDSNKDGSFQAGADLAVRLTGLADANNPVLGDFIFA